MNYLKDDFKNVSGLMEQGLVDALWLPGIKNGLVNSVNNSAQGNLIDSRNFQYFVGMTNDAISGMNEE